jgi:hypothetical protein
MQFSNELQIPDFPQKILYSQFSANRRIYTTGSRKLQEAVVPVQQALASYRKLLYLYNRLPQVTGSHCTYSMHCRARQNAIVPVQRATDIAICVVATQIKQL